MAVDVRSEIFRLRQQDPPLSHSAIAQQLGVSKSRVQRELNRTARGGGSSSSSSSNGDGGDQVVHHQARLDPVLAADPELLERKKAVELARLATQELEAKARLLEAETKLELLRNPSGAGRDGQMVAILMQEIRGLREVGRRLAAGQQGPPPKSLVDQLGEFRQMGEVMRSFAPPSPPSSAAELEFKVALQRLEFENQRVLKQLEDEMAERREKWEGQRARDEAIAKAIDNFSPLAALAAEKWLRDQQQEEKPPEQLLPPAPAQGERPTVIQGGQPPEVRGPCPNCGAELAMTPGGPGDPCPACGVKLLVSEGQIALQPGQTRSHFA